MTKTQLALWMSDPVFRFFIGFVGFLLGLLIARWLWRTYSERLKQARLEKADLEIQVAKQINKNQGLSSSLAKQRYLASERQYDWRAFEGIDNKTAQQLRTLGIRDLDHLSSLSADQRKTLEVELANNGVQWDWDQLERMKSQAAAGVGAAGGSSSSAGNSGSGSTESSSVKSDSADSGSADSSGVGIKLPMSGGPIVDWSAVKGMDPSVAKELDAMGVKNLGQLDGLEPAERVKLEARMKAKGVGWDWSQLANWKTATAASLGVAAAGLGASKIGSGEAKSSEGGASDSLSADKSSGDSNTGSGVVSGNDSGTGQAKGSFTLQPPRANPNDSSSDLGSSGERSLGSNQSESSEAPNVVAGFAAATGTGRAVGDSAPDTAEPVKENNDWQSEALSVQPIPKESNYQPGQPFEDKWESEALSVKPIPAQSNYQPGVRHFETDVSKAKTKPEGQAPVLFDKVPGVRDDLTLADGIEGPQSVALRRMGIYNFQQLRTLTAEQRGQLVGWFRKMGWNLDFEQWRIASPGNTKSPSAVEIQRRAAEIASQRESSGLDGGEWTDREQAEWELRGNPIYSFGVPENVDNFALTMTGVTPEARDELYRMGLFNADQIQSLDGSARRELAKWFSGSRFGVDLSKAFGWLASFKSAPEGMGQGGVFSKPPAAVDDLSRINGIGPATEEDLNRLGVYRYEQIANWSEENVRVISEALELEDRVVRGLWIVQAKMFASQRRR